MENWESSHFNILAQYTTALTKVCVPFPLNPDPQFHTINGLNPANG